MTGEIADVAEGLADAGTAATVAGAVERERAATDSTGHSNEGSCLNCGTALVGPHCHVCGQRAHVHRTLAAFFHDLLHGVLHFEGKTWRTIPLLVWQPGKLTREYIDGRRANYVSPIALFLFVVLLSFALFNALGGESGATPEVRGIEEARTISASVEQEIAALEAERPNANPARRNAIDERVAELRTSQAAVQQVLATVGEADGGGFQSKVDTAPLLKDTALGGVIDHIRENPQLAIYKAQTSAYKFSWMLIPLSVPFVWLLFPFNRQFRGYDHTVFVTYSIAFMIALVAAASLLAYAGWGGTGMLVLLYAPLHMYRHLRGTYGLGRFGAIWRMLALIFFAWTAIALFASAILWMAGS
jgi:hypothetical protein